MNIEKQLQMLINKRDLNELQMSDLMHNIMSGNLTDSQIAAILTALSCKGETLVEVIAAVKVMRSLSVKVNVDYPERLVDTVGCGDGSSTFNISTCCAFVCAEASVPVAKHGNRSNTSASGSSDVLIAAGVNLDLTPEQVAQCIDTLNVGFLFAPKYHSAMRHAVTARKEMGIRTLLNLLGPLTNPAGAMNQVIGTFSRQWLEIVAEVCQQLGSRHVMTVHAHDSLDEISTAAITDVIEMTNKSGENNIKHWQIDPKDYGLAESSLDAILIENAQQSLELIKGVLSGEFGNKHPASKIVLLNAAAALYVGGAVNSYADGIDAVRQILQSGKAFERFENFIALTNRL